MDTTARQGSQKRWLTVAVGLLVAFLLIAPFLVSWTWDEGGLGPTPGVAVIGASVLLMVTSLVIDPDNRPKNLNSARNVLLVFGVVLTLVGTYIWR